ncbi:hypothetical protein ACNVED_11410 [Legionella sp. D16C41]|uniref:hypothetical protein n=1 Tax=Legionella sp. D16C41 TaxID=3402688 RepID=UPI003AF7791F
MAGNNYPSSNNNNLNSKKKKESYTNQFFQRQAQPKKVSLVNKDPVSIADSFLGESLQQNTGSQDADNFFNQPLQESQFLSANYNLPPSTIYSNFSNGKVSLNAVYLPSTYQTSVVNNNNLEAYNQAHLGLARETYHSSFAYPPISSRNPHFPMSYSEPSNHESQIYQKTKIANSTKSSSKQKSKKSKQTRVNSHTGESSNDQDAIPRSTYYRRRLVDPKTGKPSNEPNAITYSVYWNRRPVDPKTGEPSNAPNAVSYSWYTAHGKLDAMIKERQKPKVPIGESEEVVSQNVKLKKSKPNEALATTPIDLVSPDNSLVDLPIDNDNFFDNSTELLPNYSSESQGIENDNVASLHELDSEDVSHAISAASSIESINANDFTFFDSSTLQPSESTDTQIIDNFTLINLEDLDNILNSEKAIPIHSVSSVNSIESTDENDAARFEHVEMPPSYSSKSQKVGINQSKSPLASQSLFNCKITERLSAAEQTIIETPSNEFDDLANSFEAEFKFSTSN